MIDEKRTALIFRRLVEKKQIKTTEVMELCGTSRETARKDLEQLQAEGICRRVHGGAVLTQTEAVSVWRSRYLTGENKSSPELEAVAEKAAKIVRPGSCVYIDAGNTMARLAQYIKNVSDLTVVTPNLKVINELAGTSVRLVSLGGELVKEKLGFIIKRTVSLDEYEFDAAFISCAGLDLARGMVMEYDDFGIRRETLRQLSKKVVLVMTSQKVNKRSLMNACPISCVDVIVVDAKIGKQAKELISGSGIQVVIA